MSNIRTQAPTPGQPIPTPPDFPVVWDDPSDARQTWTFDSVHFSEPVAPLPYAVTAAFFVGGNAGVEPRVSLIYTETVEKRGYDLTQFVNLISTNAAKILGLYPRKGALAVGSDADIVLLDTRRRHTVKAADMHEADYSPWEGRDLACWPSMTLLRGKIVVEGGALKGALSDGAHLSRKVADEIRSRPAV